VFPGNDGNPKEMQMHDIDQTQNYMEAGADPFGEAGGDYMGEGESDVFEDSLQETPFTQDEEIDLASELLTVSNDAELDQFLGSLIKKASRTVGRFVKTPVGRSLVGMLRNAAKKALPIVGGALGTAFGGPAGGMLGSKLASMGAGALGLEVEGLSEEDASFEVAKQLVRLGGAAAQRAAVAPPTANPLVTARAAYLAAARRYAPGLVGGAGAGYGTPTTAGRTGRWIRRGNKIIVIGV
jgi:hypothetical protein